MKSYKRVRKNFKESKLLQKQVNKARDMVNTPPADFLSKSYG